MKRSDLSRMVQETLEKYNLERSPEREREVPEREVHPGTKPDVVPKRRTLTPPKEAPKTNPKGLSENDKEIVNKIVRRFKNIKGKNG